MSDRSPKQFFPMNRKGNGDYTRERKQWLERDPDKYLTEALVYEKMKRSE